MNNIFKATLLLLCAVAWARAAALPASTPCPLDRNVTPNSLVQYRQMEDTFLSILNDTRHLRDRAQVYFKNTVSFTLCMGGIGLSPLLDGFKAVFKLDDIFHISILSLSVRVRLVLLVLLKEFTKLSDYIQNEQMDKM